ncbi:MULTISPECIES: hypothetical protein [Gordonia]|uniref:Uncharacterized protein n=1 Tax=Gordonia amicalis TaxID=89053 RepID=A0ABU4D906_9ACTN|nr:MULTISPECIES: hypothetical protein [Gordonia]ATD70509.1 hypothetical protein CNO18_09695 [Gordonia sp. 1D]MCZ4581807.1 hypothetical protein [Gordonia amicalis]MCZ4651129.1 hypothetical protein [Gordonia amicalis]MDJ0452141.1 hypothetical protein [Gordonia amicalis]MDV6305764.1 hypothetical protein [Gordonia amicalis]
MSQLADAVAAVGALIAENAEYKPNRVVPATATGAELTARYHDLQGVTFAIDHGIASGVVLDPLDHPSTVSALRTTGAQLLAALWDAIGRTRFADGLDAPTRAELATALDSAAAELGGG